MKNNNTGLSRTAGAILDTFVTALVCWQCGTSHLTGGGSDTEVSGRILVATGEGADGAIVAIIDTAYDPGIDEPLPENSYDTADLEGNYHTVYTGVPEDESDDCPFVLNIPVEGADRQVDGVKITVDQSVLQDWVEIDAVELVGVADRPGG